jgi:hypothetical protein
VLAIAMLVEAVDLRDDLITRGRFRWFASAHDLINTMFWPTVLFLVARSRRWARALAPGSDRQDGE